MCELYAAFLADKLIVTFNDITDRQRAEEALRKSEEEFRAIATNTPDHIMVIDRDLRYVSVVNPPTGRTMEGMIGRTDFEIMPAAEAERLTGIKRGVLESGKPVRASVAVTSPQGDLQHFEGTYTPTRDAGGRVDGLIGYFRNVTEQKRAEAERERLQEQLAQAQKMESVGRLAGGVAHDFNNLLTVINGYAAFLAKELTVRDPLREYALEIGTAGDRAASLTRQLLAFSRKQVSRPRAISLNSVVAEAERMLQRVIGEDIGLVSRLAPHLGLMMADPDQIHQVIMNLAVNARDAMPNGGKLEIATADVELNEAAAAIHPDAAPGRYVRLTVTDTGMGMTEEVRRKIFEPFFTTKEPGKGTGLGLATVYGIVRQNDGWIEVQSESGRGSTFRIHLPRIDSGVAADEAQAAPAGASQGHETVLIVEDQDAVRGLARTILNQHGYRVLEAANGLEAQVVARGHAGEIDLLLTDVVMPGMDGRLLSERLRKSRPNLRVLLMSGYAEDVLADRGGHAGLDYIQKPFAPGELAAKVREILDAPGSA